MKQVVLNIPDNKYLAFIEHIKKRFGDIQIKEKQAEKKKTKNLSSRFRGQIPKDVAEEMHKQLEQMRKEWGRDI